MRNLAALGLAAQFLIPASGCSNDVVHQRRPELAIPEDSNECGDRREVTRGEVIMALAAGPCVPPAICTPGDETDTLCCDPGEEEATEEENAAIRAFCQAGILEPFPGGGYRLRDSVTSAEFAAVAARIFGLAPILEDGDKTWYGGYYRALEKAGMLPPGELDLPPQCPPSDHFVRLVTRFCYAGTQGSQSARR